MTAAVSVRGIGKRYQIGGPSEPYGMLSQVMARTLRHPLRALRGAPGQEFWALRDVSFELDRGEAIGIVGRNGAGKSTLLKVLARITEPTTGEADIEGRVGALIEVGTGFHPELTGRENVFLGGVVLGMRRAEVARRFDEIVAFADIESFLDTPFKHYSSGMQMRLAFSVAAHLEPEVLIVDEVLAVGDAVFRRKCLDRMRTVAGEGRTVLFVSHALHSVRELCSRGLLIEDGRVAATGSVDEVVALYTNRLEQREAQPVRGDLGFTRFGCEVRPGADPELLVTAEYETRVPWERVELNLILESTDADQLLHLRDDVDQVTLPTEPGRHTVTVAVGPMGLAPGAYLAWTRLVGHSPGRDLIVDSDRVVLDIPGENPLRQLINPPHTWQVANSREPARD